jgi:hypothetical protein
MKYLEVDGNGLITNVILWDGSSEYNTKTNITLVGVDDSTPVNPGDKYENGSIISSVPVQESQQVEAPVD